MGIAVVAPLQVLVGVWLVTVGLPAAYFALRKAPLETAAWWAIAILVVVALSITRATTSTRVIADSRSIAFSGCFMGPTTYPTAQVRLDRAIRFDANDPDAPVRPRFRVWGVGLPGYSSGTFKLANGQEALVLVTSDDEVYVPTNGRPFIVGADVFQQIEEAARPPEQDRPVQHRPAPTDEKRGD